MRVFMTNLMKQQRGEQVEVPARPESLPLVDMVDDASVDSEFSYLTGDSEGQSIVALSNVQLATASEPSTVVPQPKAPVRKEVVVPPKETAITVVPSTENPYEVTILSKQVRIPIVPSTTRAAYSGY